MLSVVLSGQPGRGTPAASAGAVQRQREETAPSYLMQAVS